MCSSPHERVFLLAVPQNRSVIVNTHRELHSIEQTHHACLAIWLAGSPKERGPLLANEVRNMTHDLTVIVDAGGKCVRNSSRRQFKFCREIANSRIYRPDVRMPRDRRGKNRAELICSARGHSGVI